jgi:ABC-type transport system substrate-binding protein
MTVARGRVLGAAMALALLLGACGSGSGGDASDGGSGDPGEAAEARTGGKVAYGIIAETNGWDPSTSQWGPWSLIIANSIFDTLSRFDHQGGVQPYLAKDFRPNDDYTVWTIELREGVRFSNGEALDADVVARNLGFFRESLLTGDVFRHVTDVEVVDDLHVKVTLDEPAAQWPIVLSTQVGVVMAPAMLDDPDRALHPVGTGPFKVDEWVPDAQMTVVRNDFYWQTDADGNQLPYLDEVEYRPIVDDDARADSVRAGDIDMAQITDATELESFKEDPGYSVAQDLRSEEDENFVMLNTVAAPFDQLIARQALAYATDRDAYNEVMNGGLSDVASSPFREESPWYVDVDYPDYDPDMARELVAQYEAEFGPFEFVLESSPAVRTLTGAQQLQADWQDVGMKVAINPSEVATQIGSIVVGNYQATIWRQFGSAHPILESAWWHCDFVHPVGEIALNFAHNCNEDTDQVMDDATADADLQDQKKYWDEVQQRINDDIPYIWLTHVELGVVARPGVENIVDFMLPNHTPGLAFNNGAHPMSQVWVSD